MKGRTAPQAGSRTAPRAGHTVPRAGNRIVSKTGNRGASIGQVQSRLPGEFVASLSALFPQHIHERILRGMAARRCTTFRVNTLKLTAAEMMRFLVEGDIKYRRVSWCSEAFILSEASEREVGRWDLYRDGRIYLQSLSSMLPALALAPLPGERILDIAAAPGSKTTQMAALMKNKGAIVANDLAGPRAERLAYNLRLQGCDIVVIKTGRGEKLGAEMPESFDRVLIDAPCSGEGRFLASDPRTWRSWSPKAVAQSARLQRRLLAGGAVALKPGGILVYSTCTLNAEENEAVVQWALEHLPLEHLPLEVERIPIQVPAAIEGLAAALGRSFDPSIRRAIRILPDRDYEGFFLCRMRKRMERRL